MVYYKHTHFLLKTLFYKWDENNAYSFYYNVKQ